MTESNPPETAYTIQNGLPIKNSTNINNTLTAIQSQHTNHPPKIPEDYVGYRMTPHDIELYQLNSAAIPNAFITSNKKTNRLSLESFLETYIQQ